MGHDMVDLGAGLIEKEVKPKCSSQIRRGLDISEIKQFQVITTLKKKVFKGLGNFEVKH